MSQRASGTTARLMLKAVLDASAKPGHTVHFMIEGGQKAGQHHAMRIKEIAAAAGFEISATVDNGEVLVRF